MGATIVKLPFGQKEIRDGQGPPCDELSIIGTDIPAIAELYRHRPSYISRLLGSASLNLLNYDRGVLCLSLMVSAEDRAWLKSHETDAEKAFRRIRRIQLADSKRFWDLSPDAKISFDFPEDRKTRMRVGFTVEEGGEDLPAWRGGADFLLNTH